MGVGAGRGVVRDRGDDRVHQARVVHPEQLGRLAAPGDTEDRDLGRVDPRLARQPAQRPGEILQRDVGQGGRQPGQAEVGHAEGQVALARQQRDRQRQRQPALGSADQQDRRPAARSGVRLPDVADEPVRRERLLPGAPRGRGLTGPSWCMDQTRPMPDTPW